MRNQTIIYPRNTTRPGNTVIFTIPRGDVITRMQLIMTAAPTGGTVAPVATAAWDTYIDDVDLKANGISRIPLKAKEIVMLNEMFLGQHLTQANQDGILNLHLAQQWYSTPAGKDLTAWRTDAAMGLDGLELEFKLKTGIDVGDFYLRIETIPIEVNTATGAPSNASTGVWYSVQKYNWPTAQAGVSRWTGLAKGNYGCLGLLINSDQIADVDIEMSKQTLLETNVMTRTSEYVNSKRNVPAGYTFIDFSMTNRIEDMLNMSQWDFLMKMTTTAPNLNLEIMAIKAMYGPFDTA